MNDETLLARLLEAALDDTKNLRAERDALAAALRAVVADYDTTGCENSGVLGEPTFIQVCEALAKVTP